MRGAEVELWHHYLGPVAACCCPFGGCAAQGLCHIQPRNDDLRSTSAAGLPAWPSNGIHCAAGSLRLLCTLRRWPGELPWADALLLLRLRWCARWPQSSAGPVVASVARFPLTRWEPSAALHLAALARGIA